MEGYCDTLNTHYCLNLCKKTKHKVKLGSDAMYNSKQSISKTAVTAWAI